MVKNWIWSTVYQPLKKLKVRVYVGISQFSASKIKKFTIQDGLPSNLIQSIETDKQGNIWIGTNRGLVKLNQGYKTTIYDINDGIQNYEFSEHSSYSDFNGLLYFGGIDGISSFSPNKTEQVNYKEPVNISDIIINGINVNDRRPKNHSSSLTLRHFENNLKINFLSPNYYNQKNCKYGSIRFFHNSALTSLWRGQLHGECHQPWVRKDTAFKIGREASLSKN